MGNVKSPDCITLATFDSGVATFKLVKADPSKAGKAPVSLEDVRDEIRASATVPVN